MRPANLALRLPASWIGTSSMTARPDRRERPWPSDCGTCRVVGAGGATCSSELDGCDPAGPEALAPGFELSAAVLRHLQADPLLPAELLPARVAGSAAASPPTTRGTPATGHAERLEPGRLSRRASARQSR